MDLINQVYLVFESSVNFLLSMNFIVILAIIITLYHIILFFLRDKKHIKALQEHEDPEKIELKDLKNLPLVNIITPAWKEGKLFMDCLSSITKLDYPNLKVIVSAGGNDETINIANSFKKYDFFTIIKQEPKGKIKAINDCLQYVSEGIIYSIDADIVLTNEIILRMIYPIINKNENVTTSFVRPLVNQEQNIIVKYLLINRYLWFDVNFSRYDLKMLTGPNTCLKYDVIVKIGAFLNENLYSTSDRFRGYLISSKGFKIYQLNDYRSYIFTYYPDTIKKYINQDSRWKINEITDPYKKTTTIRILKFILSIFLSLYIIMFPFFMFLNYILFLILFLMIIFSLYLKKIRKLIFFTKTVNKIYYKKFGLQIFLIMFVFIFIDAFITIYSIFKLLFIKFKN